MLPLYIPIMPTVNEHHFVFFANASSTIGAGHVMRLLALAQVCLKEGFRVSFTSYECPQYLQTRLVQEGFEFISLPTNFTGDHLQVLHASVMVIDDYYLSDQQWQYFRDTKALLVNIDDDLNKQALICDIIVNPAATANARKYNERAPNAKLCLGAEYTMLRREFVEQAFVEIEQRNRILITLGGADVKNMSLALAKSMVLKRKDDVEIYVVLGGLNGRALEPLKAFASQQSKVFIIEKSQHIAELMMQSGLAITAAGGTLGELACVGTPSIALVSVDNQKAALYSPFTPEQATNWYCVHDVRSYIEDEKSPLDVIHNAHIIEEITAQAHELWRELCKRQLMSTQARQLIDGHGCDRIVEHILQSLGL